MNFKKYHVSRNLWSFHPNTTTVGVTLAWDGEKIVFSGTCLSAIDVSSLNFTLPKGTYTLKANANRIPVDSLTVCVDLYRASPFFQRKIENNVSVDGSVTFTIEEDMVLTIRIRLEKNVNYDGFTLKPMLNSGESALPYEPYSSEVWHDTPHYIHNTSTDTITTLPAVIYPNDTTATVGLKGQMVQSSTPSPSSPVMPEGCGERTGNLFDKDSTDPVNIYPSSPTIANSANAVSVIISVEPNTTYTFSKTAGNRNRFCETESIPAQGDMALNYVNTDNTTSFTITTGSTTHYILWWIGYSQTYADISSTIMVNEGSTALPYEPYGYKLDISSGDTTTPIYLGEVETTRKIKKLVFDGTENVDLNAVDRNRLIIQAVYTLPKSGTTTATNIICTHLVTLGSGSATSLQQGIAMRYNGTDIFFGVPFSLVGATTEDSNATIRTKVKSYLAAQYAAGTPVTVWYVLAGPETAVVNEPLMKIGDYADEIANVSIPVTTGGDTISVGTTVQPSEITANHKGWHPAIVHERTNGAWT